MHILFCVITTILCYIDSSKQQKNSNPPKSGQYKIEGQLVKDGYHLFCDALKGN